MSVKDIEPIAEAGFPRALKKMCNDMADRINRKIRVKFSTDSINTQANVEETEENIVITLPRWRGSSADQRPLQPFASTGQLGITPGSLGEKDVSPLLFTVGAIAGKIWGSVDVDSTGTVFSNATLFDNGSGSDPALSTTQVFKLICEYNNTGAGLTFTPRVNGSQGLTVCFSDPTTGNCIPTWTLE